MQPKTSPAPSWSKIFSKRPELEAPGYLETASAVRDFPKVKPKEVKKDEIKSKKLSKAVGRKRR